MWWPRIFAVSGYVTAFTAIGLKVWMLLATATLFYVMAIITAIEARAKKE